VIGFRLGPIGDVESLKRGFFDRRRVIDATVAAERRVLSRFGAFVRQRDRTSQRRGKGVSAPGRPPAAHLGLVRDLTFFAYDEANRSVVEGPAKLNRPSADALVRLEEGGETTRLRHGKEARAFYRPRPHAKPAFDEELKRMPPLWRDEIR
jgi:hypothetical protein